MISEEYSNATNFSDGEIYVQICQHAKNSGYFAERKWWARLTKRKRDFLRSFMHHPLRKALDPLLCMPSIFNGLNIGVLDKIMALKCDEVSNN